MVEAPPAQGDPDDTECRWCDEGRQLIGAARFCLTCDGKAAAYAARKHHG